MELRLTIPGTPVAQGRGRIVKVGGFSRIADPKKSKSWKGYASLLMQDAATKAGWDPSLTPLGVEVTAFWPMKGTPRKRIPRPAMLKATRPDGDNVLKAVQDAGDGVLWVDDGQIAVALIELGRAAGAVSDIGLPRIIGRGLECLIVVLRRVGIVTHPDRVRHEHSRA